MKTKILTIILLLISICLIVGFFLLTAPTGNWIIDPNQNLINQEVNSHTNPSNANPNNGAVFTGNYTVYGVDTDGDGKYNFLSIEAEINVTTGGNYGIYGSLRFDDTHITSRPAAESAVFSYYYLSSGPGLQTVTLTFSGGDIYEKGISGNYTVDLRLLDESGICIHKVPFNTSAYGYTEFGEMPAVLVSSTDYGSNKFLSRTIGAVILICLAASLFFLLRKKHKR